MSDEEGILHPGSFIGLLGGGQLARMLILAGHPLGFRFVVLDPDSEAPASQVGARHLAHSYTDKKALKELAEQCDLVTYEFENVDADSVEWLEKRVDLPQGSQLLRTAQHRLNEKKSIQNLGIGVTGFREVQTLPDLEKAFEEYGSVLLKTVSGGYDGKGQKRIRTEEEIRSAFEALHQEGIPLIAEEYQSFERELSVVVARSRFGEVRCFPVSENLHHQNILTICRIPARLSERVEKESNRIATCLAEGLGLVGVMGVEMFLLSDGDLLVNEIAPRPHNSGHFTLGACETSQFHQHLLAIAGWPLGPTELIKPTLMLNLIGEQQDKLLKNLKRLPIGVKLHLYGKKEVRPGRKMGHLNLSIENPSQVLETLKQLQVWEGEFLDRMLT